MSYGFAELGEVISEGRPVHDCEFSAQHVTGHYGVIRDLEVCGVDRSYTFIPGTAFAVVVMKPFAERLSQQKFSGLRLTEWPVSLIESKSRRRPRVFHVGGLGRRCVFPCRIVGGENSCGNCGHGPVECPKCGVTLFNCPVCGYEVFWFGKRRDCQDDRKILVSRMRGENQGCHLDASRWDGSDFVNYDEQVIVTRRVIDWLLAIGAGPWEADAARCELATVRPEQHAALLAAAGSNRAVVEHALSKVASIRGDSADQ